MGTHFRFLLLPFLSVALFSCGESHFLKEKSYRDLVTHDFEQKQRALPNGDLFAIFSDSSLSLEEREALMFLYAYMPIGDITDYSGDYYLENLRLSQQTRKEMPWGKEVDDELFRHFVLPIRVNNEALDDARKVFYGELKDRVKGLSMKDAILEVNHWCHEKVVYSPSDARTSSPLATLKTAYGRCGEESTFAVAALRAVGIPARQVYTPRWAHTDDNHAWVEAWADGQWYFLGACEPEPVLNLGWFNAPASRGMLMHTKVFGRYEGTEEKMYETLNYTEINVTANYAPTAKAQVTVTEPDGTPAAGAKVEFKLYNYAEFYSVATKYTDDKGQASLSAGKGDMLVWASKDGKFGFAKLSFGKQDALTLVLDKKEGDAFTADFDMVPPPDTARLPEVTPEQRAENDRRKAQEDSIRNAYIATFPTTDAIETLVAGLNSEVSLQDKEALKKYIAESRGNYETLIRFIREADEKAQLSKAVKLLGLLTEKDRRDVTLDVLEDHLFHTVLTEDWRNDFVLNPRVATEQLTPYRSFFQSQFSKAEVDSFLLHPQRLVEWVGSHVSIDSENNSQRIPITPEGVWRSRVADTYSRNIFFVALARSLNIPALMRETDGSVGYMDLAKADCLEFVKADFDKQASVRVEEGRYRLYDGGKPVASGDDRAKYYSRFTFAKINQGSPKLVGFDESSVANRMEGKLDAGYYLLVTGTRLADGTVLARISSFTLPAGGSDETKVAYSVRESGERVAVIGSFNSESMFLPLEKVGAGATAASQEQSLLEACGRGYFVVGILGVGQEPTNHALRDIAAMKADLEKWGRKLVLLFPGEEQSKKFLPAEFPGLPSTVVYGIDTEGIGNQIVENMKLRHKESLPVFVIADTFNRVVFVSQGYTIGLGEQLLKTIRQLDK